MSKDEVSEMQDDDASVATNNAEEIIGESICYPAASLMLEISKDEYSTERERANSLDNKSGIFISAIIALITLYLPIIPFSAIKEVYLSSDKTNIVLSTVCLCTLFLAFISLIVAFYNLSKAIALKPFQRVNFENLNDDKVLSTQINMVERGLVDHYNTILVSNAGINDNKAKMLNAGLKFSIITFMLLIIASIGLLIITG